MCGPFHIYTGEYFWHKYENGCIGILRVHLNKSESESDVASRCVHRKSNLMFALNSDKDQRKKLLLLSLLL